jgi:hypothetical protein
MSQKDYFEVGAKLIGVYALVLALPILFGFLPTVFTLIADARKVFTQFGVSYLPLLASPIVVAAIGIYLLKGRGLSQRIFLDETESSSNRTLSEYFTVGAKLYGIMLALGTVPSFLNLLANFLFVVHEKSPYADLANAATGLQTNFLPDFAVIVFGIFLLLKGEVVTSWAFPPKDEHDAGNG